MNIALLCVLIIITGETDGFHVQNLGAPFKENTEERISLRKLQNFKRDDTKEAKNVTWNQILAHALVNRIKVFSLHTVTENERATDIGSSNNFLTNCISQMMHLYKILVYDKIYKRSYNMKVRNSEDTEVSKESVHDNNAGKDDKENAFAYLKNEVEIFDPKYPDKTCDDCKGSEQNDAANTETSEIVETTETVQATVTACPAGLVASEDGGCTNPKSKFILSIPYQCPIGYRRDWLGYCRLQL